MSGNQIDARKQNAVKFLQMVIAGQIEEAYGQFVDMRGKHHNPYYPSDLLALQKGMIENHGQFPNKQYSVKHVLGDGDMVAVHGHLVFKDGEAEMIVVHLFRFQDNKIVEFWDCGQHLLSNSPNKDGAF